MSKTKQYPGIVHFGKAITWRDMLKIASEDFGFKIGKIKARDLAKMIAQSNKWRFTNHTDIIRRHALAKMGITLGPQIEPPPKKQAKAKYSKAANEVFLSSPEWRRLRMKVLLHYGARCACCGATPADGAVMNVDHIKPRLKYPELSLEFTNLQVLCGACNHGKGNWDETDWRLLANQHMTEITRSP